MKQTFMILIITVFLFSCSSKKISPVYQEGESLYEKYIDNYLKGNRVSSVYFDKAVNIFQRNDDFCNLSRIYVSRFLLNEEYKDTKALEDARFFAENGRCSEEDNFLNFVEGKEYEITKLPEYYQKYLKIIKQNNYNNIKEKFAEFPEYFVSRVLRNEAALLMNETGLMLIDEAYQIDRFNGWTLNIYRDLLIKIKIMNKLGKNTDKDEIRVKNLESILMIK